MIAEKHTIRLSLFFFLLFTSFNANLTILSFVYTEEGIPFIASATLASNYLAFIISNFSAPAIKIPLKLRFLIAGLAHIIYYSSGIAVSLSSDITMKYVISCLGAVIAGSAGGIMEVSQSRYIHLLCVKFNVPSGKLYGIFNSIYNFSTVSAGLITTFALGLFDTTSYFIAITIQAGIAWIYCLMFVKDITKIQQQIDSQLISDHQNIPIEEEQPPKPTKQILKQVFYFFPKMAPVIPIILAVGIALGISSAELTKLIPDSVSKQDLNTVAGCCMIALGVGATLGSIISGKIVDKFTILIAGRVLVGLFFVSAITFVFATQIHQLWLTFLTAFIWGFSLYFGQTWLVMVCKQCYQGRAQAFSVNKQVASILFVLFQAAEFITIQKDIQIPMVPVLGAMVIFAYCGLFTISNVTRKTVVS